MVTINSSADLNIAPGHVQKVVDHFSATGMLHTKPVSDLTPIKEIPAKRFLLTPRQYKLIGAALTIAALALSAIPFTMPLGLALAISLTLLSSSASFAGSLLYAKGSSAQEADETLGKKMVNYQQAQKISKSLAKSSKMRKIVAVACMVGSVAISFVPLLKTIEIVGSMILNGSSLLVAQIGDRLFKRELKKDVAVITSEHLTAVLDRSRKVH